MILKSCTFVCQYYNPVCYVFIFFFLNLMRVHTQFKYKKKHISDEKGLLLLSEKYRYEVVGAHNMSFSQLT